MRAIKDSVHDYIEVDGVAEALLETPEVQRLRHVKQLSTVRLVYPSANHTRFEHSLGVSHLASRALSHLDVSGARADAVRAAALLHDVGHGPYGHQTEGIIQRRLGRHHDDVADLLAEGNVARVLSDYGLDPSRVADRIAGDGKLAGLAQRVRADAALVSGCVVVTPTDAGAIAAVTEPVYDALSVRFDPASVGSVAAAGGPANPDAVARAVEDAFVDGPWGNGRRRTGRVADDR